MKIGKRLHERLSENFAFPAKLFCVGVVIRLAPWRSSDKKNRQVPGLVAGYFSAVRGMQ